jgi:hypothetical protein
MAREIYLKMSICYIPPRNFSHLFQLQNSVRFRSVAVFVEYIICIDLDIHILYQESSGKSDSEKLDYPRLSHVRT